MSATGGMTAAMLASHALPYGGPYGLLLGAGVNRGCWALAPWAISKAYMFGVMVVVVVVVVALLQFMLPALMAQVPLPLEEGRGVVWTAAWRAVIERVLVPHAACAASALRNTWKCAGVSVGISSCKQKITE